MRTNTKDIKARIRVKNKKAERSLMNAVNWANAGGRKDAYKVINKREVIINDMLTAWQAFDFMVRKLRLNVEEFSIVGEDDHKWGLMLKYPNRYSAALQRVLSYNDVEYDMFMYEYKYLRLNSHYSFRFPDFSTFVTALKLIYRARMDINEIICGNTALIEQYIDEKNRTKR